jgi:cysteine desulfurase
LRVEGVAGDLLLQALDLEGFYLSSGAACSSGALSPSPVLLALGLTKEEAASGLRISLGPTRSSEELMGFAGRFLALVDELT